MKFSPEIQRAWRRVTLGTPLDDLRIFVETVEDGFKAQLKVTKKKWKKKPPRCLSEEGFDDHFRKINSEQVLLDSQFPILIRNVTIVHLYSLWEQGLMRLCERIHDCNPFLPAPADDKNNKGIVRSQQYLKKIAKITFPDNTPEWVEICRVNDLRNWIVHGGRKSMPERLWKYLQSKKDSIKTGSPGKFLIQANYCAHVIDVYKKFEDKLFGALPDELFEKKPLRLVKS